MIPLRLQSQVSAPKVADEFVRFPFCPEGLVFRGRVTIDAIVSKSLVHLFISIMAWVRRRGVECPRFMSGDEAVRGPFTVYNILDGYLRIATCTARCHSDTIGLSADANIVWYYVVQTHDILKNLGEAILMAEAIKVLSPL
jgi:hypothetical protein